MAKISDTVKFARIERSGLLVKSLISLACLCGYFLHVGFSDASPWHAHVLYIFCHANPFHLAVNLLVLWSIRHKIPVASSLAIAIAASFLPMYVSEPTLGLSGFLFAAFGCMWGSTGRWKDALRVALPFIVCTMIVPHVNGLLHLYAFLMGYIFEYLRCFLCRWLHW